MEILRDGYMKWKQSVENNQPVMYKKDVAGTIRMEVLLACHEDVCSVVVRLNVELLVMSATLSGLKH